MSQVRARTLGANLGFQKLSLRTSSRCAKDGAVTTKQLSRADLNPVSFAAGTLAISKVIEVERPSVRCTASATHLTRLGWVE